MIYTKHFAFLLHYPSKDKFVMWPGYYEDSKEEIDKDFTEVVIDITEKIGARLPFQAFFQNNPYKVFTKKSKKEKQLKK